MNNLSTYSFKPNNLEDLYRFSKAISNTAFCPKEYKGKPEDVMVAIQMGGELGLQPMQSIQNIAVINGKPSVWGDAALALVMTHPAFESIEEKIENNTAFCTVKRKGVPVRTVCFSIDDAKKAGLWGKQGPWSNYPQRMLQMRARGFALRDFFPDALKGLILREEASDYPVEKIPDEKVLYGNYQEGGLSMVAIEEVDEYGEKVNSTPDVQALLANAVTEQAKDGEIEESLEILLDVMAESSGMNELRGHYTNADKLIKSFHSKDRQDLWRSKFDSVKNPLKEKFMGQ